MSYTEGSNRDGPYYRRILILLAVGVLITGGVVMALNSKSKLTAFHESPACANAGDHGATWHKGAEAVTPAPGDSTTPTDGPGESPSTTGAEPSADAGPSDDPSTSTSAGPCPSPSGGRGGTEADPNPDCSLIVPADPLSAEGLATPYRLTATDPAKGPCNESNDAQSAFVQATIVDRSTGKVSVYNPLVVDQGTRPAARPVVPRLPRRAVVGIWFGYNGGNLTLRHASDSCVGGLDGSVFGQFAECNARAFFAAANAAIKAKKLRVPALGTGKDGMPCMTTRDFALVDQDQSDNVTTRYLITGDDRTAQRTAANQDRLTGARTLANPSDNGLLDAFVDPALGCEPWTAPDLADTGSKVTSLALNELQAAARQRAPAALVPMNNPMTLANDVFSKAKTNLYRAGVDQPALPAGQSPATYCRDMDRIQAARLRKDEKLLTAGKSPAPDEADSLFTFMGARLRQSFENLKCGDFGLTNPVAKLRMNGDVVVGVVFAGR